MKAGRGWLEVAETGGVFGVRIIVFVGTIFGRLPARLVLKFVALYYSLTHASSRHASRDWLAKVRGPGAKVGFLDVYRHVLAFAEVAADRLFLVRKQFWRFEVTHDGHQYLRELADKKKGAILLGAHLGSFEAMRMQGEENRIPINVIGYFRNARFVNAALAALDPTANVRVIQIDPGNIDFIFKLKECIDRGELVAILGDRVGLSGPTVEVDFFGERARFPSGVYVLAAALGCPIYLTFGIYRGPNRYELHCEPFAETVVLPRKAREPAIAAYAQAYARRLEHFGRLAPDNWFNFFDFWAKPAAEVKGGTR
jgi:predicted LPLAT superfamily acyltransferase